MSFQRAEFHLQRLREQLVSNQDAGTKDGQLEQFLFDKSTIGPKSDDKLDQSNSECGSSCKSSAVGAERESGSAKGQR